jgi:hypothetical protein
VAELTETQLIAVVVAVVVVVLLAIFVTIQVGRARRRRMELQGRFGSEYARTVEEARGRREAEDDLLEREQRRRHVRLTEISQAAATDYRERLEQLQATFVTAPVSAVRTVDGLLTEVAVARGYPDGAPDRILSDVSVDHPEAVAAHRRGQALLAHAGTKHDPETEQLRRALVSSRQLFEALLADAAPAEAPPAPLAAPPPPPDPAPTSTDPAVPTDPTLLTDPAPSSSDPALSSSGHGAHRREPEPVAPPPLADERAQPGPGSGASR